MKASSANFLTVIKGPKQFVIPIYQRTYSWQIAQCNKLFNDILRISKDGSSPGTTTKTSVFCRGFFVLRLAHNYFYLIVANALMHIFYFFKMIEA